MGKTEARQTLIYARVSTNQQDTENQLTGCRDYAAQHTTGVIKEVLEEASTKVHWKERAIHGALASLPAGSFLVVSEVSRLARSTLECLEIFQEAAANGITIHAVKNALTLDGSMQARIVSTVLAMAAEIERDFIRSRTTEALARRRAQGLPLGRPVGAKSESKLAAKAAEIDRLTAAKISDSGIARILLVSRSTVARYRASRKEAKP